MLPARNRTRDCRRGSAARLRVRVLTLSNVSTGGGQSREMACFWGAASYTIGATRDGLGTSAGSPVILRPAGPGYRTTPFGELYDPALDGAGPHRGRHPRRPPD